MCDCGNPGMQVFVLIILSTEVYLVSLPLLRITNGTVSSEETDVFALMIVPGVSLLVHSVAVQFH